MAVFFASQYFQTFPLSRANLIEGWSGFQPKFALPLVVLRTSFALYAPQAAPLIGCRSQITCRLFPPHAFQYNFFLSVATFLRAPFQASHTTTRWIHATSPFSSLAFDGGIFLLDILYLSVPPFSSPGAFPFVSSISGFSGAGPTPCPYLSVGAFSFFEGLFSFCGHAAGFFF